MRFSYYLLKKIYPDIPPIKKTAELLTSYLFETDAVGKNILDIQILPNRYSDAASHWGIAQELFAIAGKKFKIQNLPADRQGLNFKIQKIGMGENKINIKTPKCRRMIAYQFDNIKIGPSPRWLKNVLADVGQQSINNLVDITNYVTLETGQPLHAFDLDKMDSPALTVRPAKDKEEVVSLDGKKYELNGHDLILADDREPLDIAGIKGGKKAAIDKNTKRILLTAGNFDGAAIYKTSKKIGLATDASVRFSHNLNPELAAIGINRAAKLIAGLCGGKLKTAGDAYRRKFQLSVHKFDINKFNKISGLNLTEKRALGYLSLLGFKRRPGRLVEAPILRTDIERFEDLAEEIIRLYGYENLPATAPLIFLKPTEDEELILFNNKIKTILAGFGLDEVYNYSFLPEELSEADAIALENPASRQFARLRPSLIPLLLKNIDDNRRFLNRTAVFEIGQIFQPRASAKNNGQSQPEEQPRLGIAIGGGKEKNVLELKGVVDGLLERLGLVDWLLKEDSLGRLRLESDRSLIGYIKNYDGNRAAAELNLNELIKLVKEEKSYEPLVKYPSVARDLSFITPTAVKFSEILSLINNVAAKYLDDVDLVDFYENEELGADRHSLTLRFVFQADNKTLTEEEVNKELAKIVKALATELDAEIR